MENFDLFTFLKLKSGNMLPGAVDLEILLPRR